MTTDNNSNGKMEKQRKKKFFFCRFVHSYLFANYSKKNSQTKRMY